MSDVYNEGWSVSDITGTLFGHPDGRAFSSYEDLSWASEDTSRSGRIERYDEVPVHALNWGTSAGKVLFTVSAAEYELLELLVAAVIEAAGD